MTYLYKGYEIKRFMDCRYMIQVHGLQLKLKFLLDYNMKIVI